MAASFTFLPDVRPYKTAWRVQVKILHTWRQYTSMTGETLELIVYDDKGSKIHAAVKKDLVNRYVHNLPVDEWRFIEKFQLTHASGEFRPTNHLSKMGAFASPVHNRVFAGKVVVFGGDFRQILPVINGAGRAEILLAALSSSNLWDRCKVLKLTKNMCLLQSNISQNKAKDIQDFSDWLLDVGDGKISEPNDGDALIDIPKDFLITEANSPIEDIYTEIYGDHGMFEKNVDAKFYQERAILAPTNDDVNIINQYMLEKLDSEVMEYLSADSIEPTHTDSLTNPVITPDFLNNI
ncbi:uncharacterized protein LOC17891499 [Capsella rubella]|uniref:uncharacterized protein LOC17891499 n=1 Tax=Capsella rubella TaxID=81985 RepID=UPI000CD50BE0|nr:uncharacterized protein LOC17891499 [Capsella rubella]